jgi:aryl-alcohol dehydrogenase-like predicted oxidoreductase
MQDLLRQGKTRAAGLSNASLEEIQAFASECPLAIYQGPYNMLQRGLEQDIIPWCQEHNVGVAAYWVLMRGLLTGTCRRDHKFEPDDKRRLWPMCQGPAWQRLQDVLDVLRDVAAESEKSVAQIVARWTLDQPGITVLLCGATVPAQVRDNASALEWSLNDCQRERISYALASYVAAA